MLNFCTLFNTTYLSRGLAMYQSLEQRCKDFHLYIIAFDQHCYEALTELGLEKAIIINLKSFENERLKAIKDDRTAQEYCWTCASSTIKYCIETYDLDHCTYVDADLMFFSDPKVLIDEMAGKSVLITDHRYTPRYDQSALSGVYCVQFVTFKNDKEGMAVLNWWVDACIEWCYNRVEDNKFGDQRYLDDWPERFSCVHVLQHLGGGVAPWNVQQYDFRMKSGKVIGKDIAANKDFELVFYHYHGFNYQRNNSYRLAHQNYTLTRGQIKKVYKPYVKTLIKAEGTAHPVGKGTLSHELNNEIEFINRVVGRAVMFFIRGYYKNFYAKRSFQPATISISHIVYPLLIAIWSSK